MRRSRLAVARVVVASGVLAIRDYRWGGRREGRRVGGASASAQPGPEQRRRERSAAELALQAGPLPADAITVHVPILMYHYVDETPPPAGPYADALTVRTGDFEAEMQYLVDNAYHTVSLADVYLAMAGREELPSKPVVLTFDDGGLDNYQVAFPLLKQNGLTATFFVITGTCGQGGPDGLGPTAGDGCQRDVDTVALGLPPRPERGVGGAPGSGVGRLRAAIIQEVGSRAMSSATRAAPTTQGSSRRPRPPATSWPWRPATARTSIPAPSSRSSGEGYRRFSRSPVSRASCAERAPFLSLW